MKKRDLKSLKFKKESISNFEQDETKGGWPSYRQDSIPFTACISWPFHDCGTMQN